MYVGILLNHHFSEMIGFCERDDSLRFVIALCLFG